MTTWSLEGSDEMEPSNSLKDRIYQCALMEFASNGYALASTNQIAKNANVAKGSIFKIYQSKAELYWHIYEKELHQMVTAMRPYLEIKSQTPLVQAIVDLIWWKALYAQEHPEASQLLLDAIAKPPQELASRIQASLKELSALTVSNFFDHLLQDNVQEKYRGDEGKKLIQIAVNGLQATYTHPQVSTSSLFAIKEEAIEFLKVVLQGMEKRNDSN